MLDSPTERDLKRAAAVRPQRSVRRNGPAIHRVRSLRDTDPRTAGDMRRQINGSVVVVVGATSGVGRATTLSLAAVGADLVVVARDAASVAEVVRECVEAGARAVGVVGDNASAADVDRIVATALERFGHVDTWINAASALVVGRLETQPVEDIERLVATNVLGNALTSRAAMRQFERQGHGVLVNVSSLLGMVPNPVVPTYVMTKFAIRGLSLSLHEAAARHRDIRVCTVLPGPIDTPMFGRAANRSGRAIRAIPPSISPERAAAAVLRSVRRPRRQRTTGALGALIMLGLRVAPRPTQSMVAQTAARLIFRRDAAPSTSGALHRSGPSTGVSGGWRRSRVRVGIGDALGRVQSRW